MNLEYRWWTLPAVRWIIIWWFFVPSCEELMWLVTHYKENIRTLESVTTSPLGIFHIWPVATFNLFTTLFLLHRLFWLYVIASSGFVLSGERGHRGPLLVWQAPGAIFCLIPSKTQGKKDFLNSPFQASRGWKELFGAAVFFLSVRVFWKCLSMLPALVLACLFVFCICFVYVSWSFLLLYIYHKFQVTNSYTLPSIWF